MPAPYTDVQCIAFNIKPGTQIDPKSHKPRYLGHDDAKKDMLVRCAVMKNAIQKAYARLHPGRMARLRTKLARGVQNAVDSPTSLKVFMAPEFYFRGTFGAYPFELIPEIIPEMRKETDKDRYADWLFVFGTAIGHQGHGPEFRQIRAVETDGGGKTVIAVASLPHGSWDNATVDEYASARAANIEDITALDVPRDQIADLQKRFGHDIRITLDRDPGFKTGDQVQFQAEPGSGKNLFTVKAAGPHPKQSSKPTITIDHPRQNPCPTCGHYAFIGGAIQCRSCNHTHRLLDVGSEIHANTPKQSAKVTKVEPLGGDSYKLTLDSSTAFDVGNMALLTPDSSNPGIDEVLNVALVRKGGPEPTSGGGIREALVYKEYVSHIDYLGPHSKGYAAFHDDSGSGRRIELGGTARTVMPTSGSRDLKGPEADDALTGEKRRLLGTSANVPGEVRTYSEKGVQKQQRISEVMKSYFGGSAIGGGTVFTIDGIAYGLEVCRDHSQNRLWNYYNDDATATPPNTKACVSGDPKVQILLIPSWGMTIGGGKVCCVTNGLVFNVDGGESKSVLRVFDGKYGCDDHLNVAASTAGACAHCGVKYYYCKPCWSKAPSGSVSTDPCTGCNGPLSAHPETALVGTAILPTGSSVRVDTKAARSTKPRYFENVGEVVVYPIQPIPKAQTVT